MPAEVACQPQLLNLVTFLELGYVWVLALFDDMLFCTALSSPFFAGSAPSFMLVSISSYDKGVTRAVKCSLLDAQQLGGEGWWPASISASPMQGLALSSLQKESYLCLTIMNSTVQKLKVSQL